MTTLFLKSFILAFAGSVAPAMVLNIEKRLLHWAGLCGALGYCIALAVNPFSDSLSVAQIFTGTVAVGLYSELMARRLKSPATVFCIPGIIPLVPGVSAYQTMQSLVANNIQEASAYAVNTIFKAFAIAFGIMIVSAVFRFLGKIRKKQYIR
ncbi:MAG TPA: threonine/serine exporter [Clostridiaceae bacterium]|nr:threonine/serine exporter [Clostridiaceae bacterium]